MQYTTPPTTEWMLSLVDTYKPILSLTLSSRREIMRADRTLRRFVHTCGLDDPSQLTAGMIQGYLSAMAGKGERAAVHTLQNHRGTINRWCQWLVNEGLMERNPCAAIRLKRAPDPMPVYLTHDELRQALEIADANGIWPEVAIAVSTGLRLSELRFLTWDTVNLAERMLAVRGKGGKVRRVPLNLLAREALHIQRVVTRGFSYVFPGWRCSRCPDDYVDRPRGENWWKNTALRPLQEQIAAFARIPVGRTGRGWHIFRHTFASHLVQAGVRIYKVAQWLGHSTVHTTRLYAHLEPGFDEDIELVGTDCRSADRQEAADQAKKVARELG